MKKKAKNWLASHEAIDETETHRQQNDASENSKMPINTLESTASVVPSKIDKKTKEKEKSRKKALKAWRYFFIKLGIIAVIGYVLFGFVFGFAIVKDASMQPRISSGDLTLLYRLEKEDIETDEVVAYTVDGVTYFGRVKAKPGDIVDITDDGSLYINNAVISETEIYSKTYKEGSALEFPYTVPEGCYFILGDNRTACFDSRICGPVAFENIEGKLIGLLRRRGF